MAFESFPFVVGWELTLACNLRCRHCASSAGDARPDELSLEEALGICDELRALLVQEVVFTGGEPTLSPLWEPLARRLSEYGIRAGMVTNGTNLTDAMIARMREAGVTALAISLDGMKETHDYIRAIPGLFERVMGGIRRALEAGFTVTVITTVNSRSLPELPALLPVLKEAGVKRWQLQPIFAFGRTRESQHLQLSFADYEMLGEFVLHWRPLAKEWGLEIFPADGIGYFSERNEEGDGWRGCSAGVTACGIMSDGRIKGCLSWPDSLVEGSLREDYFWNIWFRDGAFAYTRNVCREDIGGECSDCDKWRECGGGCLAMSIAATGRMHADPYCFRALSKERLVGVTGQ